MTWGNGENRQPNKACCVCGRMVYRIPAHLGKETVCSKECKAVKVRAQFKGKRGKSPTPETRAKIAATLRGRPGRPHSQAAKDKMRAARIGWSLPQEAREKISRTLKGRPRQWRHTPETLANLSAAMRINSLKVQRRPEMRVLKSRLRRRGDVPEGWENWIALVHPGEENRLKNTLRMWRRYKLTAQEFAEMWERQCGTCAICGTELHQDGRLGYAIDHDHANGRVRGILCHGCNAVLLGSLERIGFDRIATYLRNANDREAFASA